MRLLHLYIDASCSLGVYAWLRMCPLYCGRRIASCILKLYEYSISFRSLHSVLYFESWRKLYEKNPNSVAICVNSAKKSTLTPALMITDDPPPQIKVTSTLIITQYAYYLMIISLTVWLSWVRMWLILFLYTSIATSYFNSAACLSHNPLPIPVVP